MSLTNIDNSHARPLSRTVSIVAVTLVHAAMFYAFTTGMDVVKVLKQLDPLKLVSIPVQVLPRPIDLKPPALKDLPRLTDLTPRQPVVTLDNSPPIETSPDADAVGDELIPAQDEPVGAGPVVESFAILRRVDPVYPASARRDGAEGSVLLNVVVGPDGHVTSITVARSSGYMSLDDAAMAAVARWQFTRPAQGSVQLKLPVSFKLERVRM